MFYTKFSVNLYLKGEMLLFQQKKGLCFPPKLKYLWRELNYPFPRTGYFLDAASITSLVFLSLSLCPHAAASAASLPIPGGC